VFRTNARPVRFRVPQGFGFAPLGPRIDLLDRMTRTSTRGRPLPWGLCPHSPSGLGPSLPVQGPRRPPDPRLGGEWKPSWAARRRLALGQAVVGRVSDASSTDLPFGGVTLNPLSWALVRSDPTRAQAWRPEHATRSRSEGRLGSSSQGPPVDLGRPTDQSWNVRSWPRDRLRSVLQPTNGTPKPSPTGRPRSSPTRRPLRPIAPSRTDLGRHGPRRL
jgi:hypothetical protein